MKEVELMLDNIREVFLQGGQCERCGRTMNCGQSSSTATHIDHGVGVNEKSWLHPACPVSRLIDNDLTLFVLIVSIPTV